MAQDMIAGCVLERTMYACTGLGQLACRHLHALAVYWHALLLLLLARGGQLPLLYQLHALWQRQALVGAPTYAHALPPVPRCHLLSSAITADRLLFCVVVRYATPASHAEQFEASFRRRLPQEFERNPHLLHDIVTQVGVDDWMGSLVARVIGLPPVLGMYLYLPVPVLACTCA